MTEALIENLSTIEQHSLVIRDKAKIMGVFEKLAPKHINVLIRCSQNRGTLVKGRMSILPGQDPDKLEFIDVTGISIRGHRHLLQNPIDQPYIIEFVLNETKIAAKVRRHESTLRSISFCLPVSITVLQRRKEERYLLDPSNICYIFSPSWKTELMAHGSQPFFPHFQYLQGALLVHDLSCHGLSIRSHFPNQAHLIEEQIDIDAFLQLPMEKSIPVHLELKWYKKRRFAQNQDNEKGTDTQIEYCFGFFFSAGKKEVEDRIQKFTKSIALNQAI